MNKVFSKQFMLDNKGCYSPSQLNSCSFMKGEEIKLEDILTSEIPLKDKFWFVCRKVATKEQNQQIAIFCAETVLVLFENKYPDDKRPREAIQAAKDYLSGIITRDELLNKRAADAAAAAYTAAYTAADAYAAADAAYTAAYAAADAADAADAAYTAAAAAARPAHKNLNDVLLTFLIEFCKRV